MKRQLPFLALSIVSSYCTWSQSKIYISWQLFSLKGLFIVLYLYGFQEQAAAAAAKMDASQVVLENCSDEVRAAHELAAAATADPSWERCFSTCHLLHYVFYFGKLYQWKPGFLDAKRTRAFLLKNMGELGYLK